LKAVLDIVDQRIELPKMLGEQVGEVSQLLDLALLAGLEQHDQIVDRPEILERFAIGIDLPVSLRDQIEDVGLQAELRAEQDPPDHGQHTDQEHQAVMVTAEALHPQEDLVLAAELRAVGRGGGHGAPGLRRDYFVPAAGRQVRFAEHGHISRASVVRNAAGGRAKGRPEPGGTGFRVLSWPPVNRPV
jgi:hypothetical protein